jgi:hypothetical protein
VDFHPSVPRIFVDFVTRISYNSSSSKICVDHRPVAGRFAVCQSTSPQRRARAPLNSVQIHAHRRPHCAFFAQSGGVPARQADISGRRTSWMGRSVSARPPADERESPEDQKPDEKREGPSFRPSKQDPFYLGLRDDLRKARRTARRNIDNARRRERRAADPDHRDKCRAQSHGLSLQAYRAMRERQKNVCGICKTPGKPLTPPARCGACCAATAISASATTRTTPSLPGRRRPIWKPRDVTTGISGALRGRARFDLTFSCSARACAGRWRRPGSCKSEGCFRGPYGQLYDSSTVLNLTLR